MCVLEARFPLCCPPFFHSVLESNMVPVLSRRLLAYLYNEFIAFRCLVGQRFHPAFGSLPFLRL